MLNQYSTLRQEKEQEKQRQRVWTFLLFRMSELEFSLHIIFKQAPLEPVHTLLLYLGYEKISGAGAS